MKYLLFSLIHFSLTCSFLSKLVGLIEIFRHGADAPLRYFKNVEHLFSPFKAGELTPKGIMQMSMLGEYMKKEYFHDCPKLSNYAIYSNDVPRCINSAIAHFHSLFPQDILTFSQENTIGGNISFQQTGLNKYQDYEEYVNSTNCEKIHEEKVELLNLNNDKILAARECFQFQTTILDNDDITDMEKQILLKINGTLPLIFHEIQANNFSIASIKNAYKNIDSIIHHFPDQFDIPKEVVSIFQKYQIKYNYQYLINDDEKKLLSSNLLDLSLNMFENITTERQNHSTSSSLSGLFFSGRDVNILNLISNLIDEDYLKIKIIESSVNSELENDFLLPSFASVHCIMLKEISM